jgi:threonylcarbamoyladenosine tRNA methylthiotransferase MtaB
MTHEVITFGCRLNDFESEIIKKNLNENQLSNVAVFNTCAVTKEAERQARQNIRRYIKNNPDTKIIVTGCSAQINPEQYLDIEGIDKIIGNDEKLKSEIYSGLSDEFESRVKYEKAENSSAFLSNEEKLLVNDIFSVEETANHLISGFEEKTRAFVQIQNGCNHRCTFCIIPYGRGNSRSVPIGEIVKQVKLLTDKGYKEIVLTGVDITDYGLDLPAKPRLGQMIRRLVSHVPEIHRIRLSSVDVAEMDEDIFWLLENEPRFMPHFHLSLQAGDNMVLKRMKRRHSREDVLRFFDRARKIREDVVFGADIIAGFPTETDEMFENSLKIIEESEIIHGHIFPYSEREGTPAAKIPQNKQVPKQIRKERAALLRDASQKQLNKFLNNRVGKTETILCESKNTAKTEHFCKVKISDSIKLEAGDIVEIKAIARENDYLIAN